MSCLKEFVCNCGTDRKCLETLTGKFGSIIIDEDSDINLHEFKETCASFEKFVMGFCKKNPSK